MTYIQARDPNRQKEPDVLNPMTHGPARNWYPLLAAHVATDELPAYGRALRVRMSSAATVPLVIVGVPIGEADDAATRTVNVDATELLPFGFRRIHTLNGSAGAIPSGVNIDVITE